MNDIEKMLRDGVSAEDIIKEVNKTKERIKKEAEARKQAEEEKAKLNAKIAETRNEAITAIMKYMKTLGLDLSEEDIKEVIQLAEIYCKQLEKEVHALNLLSKSIL
jgi:uncharacterized protein YpuA (DUF1002 family)